MQQLSRDDKTTKEQANERVAFRSSNTQLGIAEPAADQNDTGSGRARRRHPTLCRSQARLLIVSLKLPQLHSGCEQLSHTDAPRNHHAPLHYSVIIRLPVTHR